MASELFRRAQQVLPSLVQTTGASGLRGVLTHAATGALWNDRLAPLLPGVPVLNVFPELGNVAAASIPAALAASLNSGSLQGSDPILCVVASAGMSFATARFALSDTTVAVSESRSLRLA